MAVVEATEEAVLNVLVANEPSVRALVAAIERFTRSWNDGASPFRWVKTADQILAKAVRKPQATSGAGH